ncbi:hypothetical protein JCM10207_004753 [Rhodosporidiobolus poonsookiae]
MATTTTTATVPATASIHFKPSADSSLPTPPLTRPPSPSPSPAQPRRRERYAAPATSHLSAYPSHRYIPALGLIFEQGIQVREFLNLPDEDPVKEELFEELAYAISLHGVCILPAQDLTPDELGELALRLGRASGAPEDSSLHIHPTAELGENGRPTVGTISNMAGKDGRRITFKDDRSDFASMGLHSDISFERRPARYSMLRMHTIPPLGGNTTFNSAYAHYDMLSEPMKEFLSKLRAVHSGSMFRQQAQLHGFQLHMGPRGAPENVGDEFEASHPIIRTNAVTGFNELFVNQTFTERIEGLSFDESRAILDYLFRLQAQAHDAMLSYRWNVNDLAIWDNSAVCHAATFDYTALRAGDRTVCVGEAPFFDSEGGRSRKATIGSPI